MRIKKGFILRKVKDEYMAVTVGAAANDLNGIIILNESGAFLWNLMKTDTTKEAMVEKMLETYEDLTAEAAMQALEGFLEKIQVAVEE